MPVLLLLGTVLHLAQLHVLDEFVVGSFGVDNFCHAWVVAVLEKDVADQCFYRLFVLVHPVQSELGGRAVADGRKAENGTCPLLHVLIQFVHFFAQVNAQSSLLFLVSLYQSEVDAEVELLELVLAAQFQTV